MAFPTGYTKYQNVTIDNTKVSATETNFPVYIDLSDLDKAGSDIFDTCRSDGGDIRVTLSDGTTELAREVVSIDTTGKTGELHVNIPSLSSSVDTVIRIWYNGTDTEPAEDSTYGKEATWNSNYKMVQHMNQDPSGSSPQMIDSTSNDNDGTSYGSMTSGDLVAAKIGNGLDFDGSDDRIIFNVVNLGTAQTGSFWLNITSMSGIDTCLGHVSYSDGGYFLSFSSTTLYFSASGSYVSVSYSLSTSTDYLITVVRDGTSVDFYVNSSQVGTTQTLGSNNDLSISTIGAYNGGGNAANCVMDEVRMLTSASSSDWISTEHNNQSSPGTFYSVSDEQAGGGSTLSPDKLNQSQALDNLDLVQQHVLSIDSISQNQVIDNIDLIQQHVLSIDPINQVQGIDNIILSSGSILEIAKIIQNQNIDIVTLTQQHSLAVEGLEQSQSVENITLDAGVVLAIASIIQSQTIDNIDLTQANLLNINSSEQSQSVENVTISIFEGKIFIDIILKKSDIDITLKKSNIDLTIN